MTRRITPATPRPQIGKDVSIAAQKEVTPTDAGATSDAPTKEQRAAMLGRGGETAGRPDGIGESDLSVGTRSRDAALPGSDTGRPDRGERGDLLGGSDDDDGGDSGSSIPGAGGLQSGLLGNGDDLDRGLGERSAGDPPSSTLPPGVQDPFGIGAVGDNDSPLTAGIADGPSRPSDAGALFGDHPAWDPESGEVVQRTGSPAATETGVFLTRMTGGVLDGGGYKGIMAKIEDVKAKIDWENMSGAERDRLVLTLTKTPAPPPVPAAPAPTPEPTPTPAPTPEPAPAPEPAPSGEGGSQPSVGDPGPDGGEVDIPARLAEDFARFDRTGAAIAEQLRREQESGATPDSTPDPTAQVPIGSGTAITAHDHLVGDDRRGVDNGGGGGDGLPSMGGQIGAINPGPDGTGIRFHGLDQEVDVERANDDVSHLAPDPIGSGSTSSDDDSDSSDSSDDSLGATDDG